MNEIPDKATLDRILELVAREVSLVKGPEGIEPVVIVPSGCAAVSLAQFAPPPRIKQEASFLECGSFVDYVNRFKTEETLIFANVTETSVGFVAVLDYHGAAPGLKPARCEHRANFKSIETPEWKAWLAANRKVMDQVEFATWLEDNATLMVEPAGAELLELVRSLHGHTNARFNTALRLDNGAYSNSYDEDVTIKGTSSTRGGSMDLPPTIQAGIAPFQGAEKYEVTARLKSRVAERKLFLWFETIALHVIVRDSILLLTKQVAEKTGIIPLLGNP